MDFDFDVIVVGSGAGGASFANACAKAGKSVLIIERGKRPSENLLNLDERITLIEKLPYDDREVEIDGLARRLYMGGVLGGSTAVYGGAMLRPSSEDFHPGKHYNSKLPRELWDWPVTYEDLRPFYDQAEQLFKISGKPDEKFGPLHPPLRLDPTSPLPLAPINERLIAQSHRLGLNPFQLPLAIDSTVCKRCDKCAGFLCPHSARRSAEQIVDESIDNGSVHLMTNTEVERLRLDGQGRVTSVVARDRENRKLHELRALCYGLAAGAIGSPSILLRSRICGPHVGGNYMMHYSPIAVGLFAHQTGADDTFIKQVGFSDFYFGTHDCPYKLGIIQSLPAPGPLMMAKSGLRRLPSCLLKTMRRRMLPLVGIIEDLPSPQNRVFLKDNGAIGLRHMFSSFDKHRGHMLGKAMARILRRAGAILVSARAFPSVEHVAHQCGTLRFGNDPRYAVTDADCRVYGKDNLFVVDGSVLPTSLGVGPSLTIVANALRVAKIAVASI